MTDLVASLVVSLLIAIASLFNALMAEKAIKSFRDNSKNEKKNQDNENKTE